MRELSKYEKEAVDLTSLGVKVATAFLLVALFLLLPAVIISGTVFTIGYCSFYNEVVKRNHFQWSTNDKLKSKVFIGGSMLILNYALAGMIAFMDMVVASPSYPELSPVTHSLTMERISLLMEGGYNLFIVGGFIVGAVLLIFAIWSFVTQRETEKTKNDEKAKNDSSFPLQLSDSEGELTDAATAWLAQERSNHR